MKKYKYIISGSKLDPYGYSHGVFIDDDCAEPVDTKEEAMKDAKELIQLLEEMHGDIYRVSIRIAEVILEENTPTLPLR